jgi:hypothetical protein
MVLFSAFNIIHELFHKCFRVDLENCNHEQFPKLPGIVSNTTWKFCPDQYYQEVLEMFPGSFRNVSWIQKMLLGQCMHACIRICGSLYASCLSSLK